MQKTVQPTASNNLLKYMLRRQYQLDLRDSTHWDHGFYGNVAGVNFKFKD